MSTNWREIRNNFHFQIRHWTWFGQIEISWFEKDNRSLFSIFRLRILCISIGFCLCLWRGRACRLMFWWLLVFGLMRLSGASFLCTCRFVLIYLLFELAQNLYYNLLDQYFHHHRTKDLHSTNYWSQCLTLYLLLLIQI